jgi:hypothetical protein
MKDFSAIRLHEMRAKFVSSLEKLLGQPYVWGGDDPIQGFDCSGAINEALQTVGVTEHGSDYSADGLMRLFVKAGKIVLALPNDPAPGGIKAGCLVFYLKGGEDADHAIAEHVEAFVNDWQILGAIGGGKPQTSYASVVALHPRMADFPKWLVEKWIAENEADRRGAFVKERPFGYRSAPFVVVDPFMPAPGTEPEK